MNDKKKGLGKGLSALIPPSTMAEASRETLICPVEELKPNRRQPRSRIDPKRLEELARSIKEKGIIQPVIVRKIDKGYEIIAGERRWRAAIKAGLTSVPIMVKEASDAEALEMARNIGLQSRPRQEKLSASHWTLLDELVSDAALKGQLRDYFESPAA
jgi:ParB family chromosome partitioning protein